MPHLKAGYKMMVGDPSQPRSPVERACSAETFLCDAGQTIRTKRERERVHGGHSCVVRWWHCA
jgi:hypothetical protein